MLNVAEMQDDLLNVKADGIKGEDKGDLKYPMKGN